jgi:hypothetical protein
MTEVDLEMKMSLRLWSDARDLSDIVRELGKPPHHAYKRGELVHVGRHGKPRVPKRHYVSYPDVEAHDFGKIEPWLSSGLDLIERSILSAGLIRDGAVEAILWIAVFGNVRVQPPAICSEIVERARALGIRILIENYSSDPDSESEPPHSGDEPISSQTEMPTKTWYPAD